MISGARRVAMTVSLAHLHTGFARRSTENASVIRGISAHSAIRRVPAARRVRVLAIWLAACHPAPPTEPVSVSMVGTVLLVRTLVRVVHQRLAHNTAGVCLRARAVVTTALQAVIVLLHARLEVAAAATSSVVDMVIASFTVTVVLAMWPCAHVKEGGTGRRAILHAAAVCPPAQLAGVML